MIKSNKGKVEITGTVPDILADLRNGYIITL